MAWNLVLPSITLTPGAMLDVTWFQKARWCATLCSFRGVKLDSDGPLDCGVMLGKPCHETIKHWFSSPTPMTVPVKKKKPEVATWPLCTEADCFQET